MGQEELIWEDMNHAKLNEISYVTVAQQGNTVDFGDLITARDSPRGANGYEFSDSWNSIWRKYTISN